MKEALYYEGQFKNDLKHGHGVYHYNKKEKYEGEYADDEKHGKGILYYTDGSVYEGDWVNG